LSFAQLCSDGSSAFVEQAVQLAVAAAKAQLQHATSDAQDLLRKLVLQGNNNNLQSSASNNLILPEQVTHEAQD
jgi:hypothetical protein